MAGARGRVWLEQIRHKEVRSLIISVLWKQKSKNKTPVLILLTNQQHFREIIKEIKWSWWFPATIKIFLSKKSE